MLMRGGRSRAAAEAEARRIIAQRRTDSPEGDLPPRIAAFLATRARLDAKGKPCGDSFIAANKKCGQAGGAIAPVAAPARKPNLGKVAAVIGVAAAGAAAVSQGNELYKNRHNIELYKRFVPAKMNAAVMRMSKQDIRDGLAKVPGPFRDQAEKLVGKAKAAMAYVSADAQGYQLTKVDNTSNFSTWKTKEGDRVLTIGSVGDTLITFSADKKTTIDLRTEQGRGVDLFDVQFTSDLGFQQKTGLSKGEQGDIASMIKGMNKVTMANLPNNAVLRNVPFGDDGLGRKRAAIYKRFGFKPLDEVKGSAMFAVINNGKVESIPSGYEGFYANLIKGGSYEDAVAHYRERKTQDTMDPERADAGEKRLGKPCGKSHIARNLKCRSESGTAKALRTAAKVALVAGAVAGGVTIAKQWTKADDDALEEAVRANRLAPEFVKKYEDAAKDPEVAELRAQREADRIKRCGRQDSGKPEAGRSDAYKDCDRQIGSASAYAKVFVRGDAGTVLKVPNPSAGMTKYEVMSAAANEFKHLELVHGAGIDVPRPIRYNPRTGVIEMDYLEGAVALNDFHKNSTLAPSRRLGIAMDLADSAQSMHRLGIGHYDLHGNNVMVTPEGTPFMLDFGLARSLKHHDMFETGDAIFNDLHRLPRRILECASDRPAIAATKEINDWLTMRHLPFVHGLQDGKLPEAALAPNIDAYYRDLRKATKYKLTNPRTTLNLKMNL
jgi:hypothetical protein